MKVYFFLVAMFATVFCSAQRIDTSEYSKALVSIKMDSTRNIHLIAEIYLESVYAFVEGKEPKSITLLDTTVTLHYENYEITVSKWAFVQFLDRVIENKFVELYEVIAASDNKQIDAEVPKISIINPQYPQPPVKNAGNQIAMQLLEDIETDYYRLHYHSHNPYKCQKCRKEPAPLYPAGYLRLKNGER